MTRFLITLDHGVNFVLRCIDTMLGGEICVPKIPSVCVMDLARVVAPDCEYKIIGIRPGEKLHETLVPEDDARMAIEFEDHYVIQPSHSYWNQKDFLDGRPGEPCPEGFRYSSDTNPWWLSDEEIAALVAEVEANPSVYELPTPTEPHFITGG
jgi:UDP-N-acetylglucosamine 4,6-dehydratase